MLASVVYEFSFPKKKHRNLKKPHFRPDTKPKIEVVSLMLCCYCRCDGQNSASRSPHGLHYHRCSYFQPTRYVFLFTSRLCLQGSADLLNDYYDYNTLKKMTQNGTIYICHVFLSKPIVLSLKINKRHQGSVDFLNNDYYIKRTFILS
ncbi:hypothetical protein Hanom_Chr09g00797091 [Helianthus anomalus]